MSTKRPWGIVVPALAACAAAGGVSAQNDAEHAEHTDARAEHDAQAEHGSASRFPDEPMPLRIEGFPQRPRPLLELGDPFLGTGPIQPGFETPTGAVWQPSFLVYGSYRSALQTFDNGVRPQITEWVNRLDLFGNLYLTPTERVLVGVRPFDEDNQFSGYVFEPDGSDGWNNALNGRITTLFFEGDIGEIFPGVDPADSAPIDWGFSVGRQPLLFQDGLLIDDDVDGLGLVRDTLTPPGGSDLRMTFFWGWDNIHRDDNQREGGTNLFGLFTEADFPSSTVQLDLVYVLSDNDTDGLYWGAGATQRLGHLNSTFRYVGSQAVDGDSAEVSSGHLLFTELSWTPHHTHDLVYVNAFWGIDQFASAARGPDRGGPLGRTGIMFAAVGLGNYGAPLGNRADDSVGAALGYQMFFDETRKQLVLEAGARTSTETSDLANYAVGGRWLQAMGQHTILRFDAFVGFPEFGDTSYGGRVELQFKF